MKSKICNLEYPNNTSANCSVRHFLEEVRGLSFVYIVREVNICTYPLFILLGK